MLSENDLKVLRAILQGHVDPQSIARDLNIKVEAARAAADALAEKGLIRVNKSVDELFTLTEEGPGESCCSISHMAFTYSGAHPQSRAMSSLPNCSFSREPAAIRRAALMIFCVTNRSGRKGDSWLKSIPLHANNP